MKVKEIQKANTTKANATRGSVYTIHKYTLTNTSYTFQINHQQQACGTVTIESWIKQEHEPSTLTTF